MAMKGLPFLFRGISLLYYNLLLFKGIQDIVGQFGLEGYISTMRLVDCNASPYWLRKPGENNEQIRSTSLGTQLCVVLSGLSTVHHSVCHSCRWLGIKILVFQGQNSAAGGLEMWSLRRHCLLPLNLSQTCKGKE